MEDAGGGQRGDHAPQGEARARAGIRLPRYFRRNVITTYLKTGSTALVSLVMTPVLVIGLGKEAFGIWVVATSLGVFRDLLQLGLGNATPRYVAESSAVGDVERIRSAIATSFWILAALGTVALALGVTLAAVFPQLFDVEGDLRTPAQILMLLMAIDYAVGMPASAFTGALMGLQRYDLVNTTQVVLVFAQAAAWAIALALGGGLVALGAIGLGLNLAGNLIRYRMTRRLVPNVSVAPRRADRRLFRPLAGYSFWLGVEDWAYVLINRVDAVVVGLVLGVGAAGTYGVGQRLSLALAQLVQPVSALFFPHSSELAAKGDMPSLRRSLITGTRLLFAIAVPLALTLGVLAGPIVDEWVGSGFEPAATVATLLAVAVVVWVLIDVGLVMLQGMGVVRRPAVNRAAEAGLNVCLSVLLAHLIGLEGVALATLVAAASANLFILLPYICRHFGIRVRDYVLPLLVAHAPAVAISLLVAWLVRRADPTDVLGLAAAAVAILLAYLTVFWITGLSRRERRAILGRTRLRSRHYAPSA